MNTVSSFIVVLLSLAIISVSTSVYACQQASNVTCITYCETDALADQSKDTAIDGVEEQMESSEKKMDKKLDDTDEDNTASIKAASSVSTNGYTLLAQSFSKAFDATNAVLLRILKQSLLYEAIRNLAPDSGNVYNQNVSKNIGVLHGQSLQKAATTSMTRDTTGAYQYVEGERTTAGDLRRKSRGGTIRELYNDWLTKHCVPTANNGLAGSITAQSTDANGNEITITCGEDRATDDPALENLDIKVADIMFKPNTLPREDILDAEKAIVNYLGAKPIKRIAPRDYANPESQQDVMEQRTLMARKNLADMVFHDLAMKRAPSIPSQYIKGIILNDMDDNPDLADIVNLTGDTISYAQWMDLAMSKRYLGTDYYFRTAKMRPGQVEREITSLLANRLIQQRDRYNMLEQILGLLSADYTMDIEEMASAGGSTAGLAQ